MRRFMLPHESCVRSAHTGLPSTVRLLQLGLTQSCLDKLRKYSEVPLTTEEAVPGDPLSSRFLHSSFHRHLFPNS